MSTSANPRESRDNPKIAEVIHDPVRWGRMMWPDVRFYDKQEEIIYSVEHNDETFVVAGNMLGKDFVSGFLALRHFLCYRESRVITTSVKDDHLRVLWGEILRFVDTCRYPLRVKDGGPLVVKHRDIRKMRKYPDGERRECKISYLLGMVSESGEGLAGHHASHTLCIIDEASGIDDLVYTQQGTWAKRLLVIGNPNPCVNFFYKGVKGGSIVAQ